MGPDLESIGPMAMAGATLVTSSSDPRVNTRQERRQQAVRSTCLVGSAIARQEESAAYSSYGKGKRRADCSRRDSGAAHAVAAKLKSATSHTSAPAAYCTAAAAAVKQSGIHGGRGRRTRSASRDAKHMVSSAAIATTTATTTTTPTTRAKGRRAAAAVAPSVGATNGGGVGEQGSRQASRSAPETTGMSSSAEMVAAGGQQAAPNVHYRGPKRAAAAAAVARLASTRENEERAEKEQENEEKRVSSNREQTTYANGLLASLSDGTSRQDMGQRGPRGEATLEGVWMAIGAEYFQDPLVVKVHFCVCVCPRACACVLCCTRIYYCTTVVRVAELFLKRFFVFENNMFVVQKKRHTPPYSYAKFVSCT